jgi:rod shape-determining protein MreD
MSEKADSHGGIAVIISFIVAMLLSILPLPDMIVWFKPDWVTLTLIYWVMALPNRVGVFSGWLLGLMVDVLHGETLGINALSLALVAYLVQMIFHRIRLFPRWKQALNVGLIVGINLLIVLILSSFVKSTSIDFSYWFPLIMSAIFWQAIFIVLRSVRRKYC